MAEITLWDDLPLDAIALAHKKRAEFLMADRSNADAAYVEHLKYLKLYPDQNTEEYVSARCANQISYIADSPRRKSHLKRCIFSERICLMVQLHLK
jgi:hypothetical protein